MILEIICNGLYFSRWQYRRTRAPHLGLAKFCIFGGGKFLLPSHVFSHTPRQEGTSASEDGTKVDKNITLSFYWGSSYLL